MSSMVENVITTGAENRPPMLERSQYDSWQSHMLLYIQGKEHGERLLESVKKGPFQFGAVDVRGTATSLATTRDRTLADLTPEEKICKACDIKTTNIILQGSELLLQERESKLYNNVDRFTYEKGETIHLYYLRFAKLINNMNTIKMTMQKFQVNTKFMNNLQPEWSKFVTYVNLAKDMHNVSFDQLYTYLRQHEAHANEVRMMRERFPDPLALVANTYNSPPFYNNHQPYYYQQFSTIPQQQQFYSPLPQQQTYEAPFVHQQSPAVFPQLDSCLAVPKFLPTDDLIESLNKAMAFLSSAITSRYPHTNNQLRTSSNIRNHATIQDGRVTVQNVQGRQTQGYASNVAKGNATGIGVIRNTGNTTANQAKVIRCYNCKGEGHITKQCTQPKRAKNSEWVKDKMLLAQAEEAGVALDEERLAFLADTWERADSCTNVRALTTTAIFQTYDIDAFDSDCDEVLTASAVFMENFTSYDSNVLSEVPNYDTYHDNNVFDQSVYEMHYSKQPIFVNDSNIKITSDNNVISYDQYLKENENEVVYSTTSPKQQDAMIMSVIEEISNQVSKCNAVNQENKIVNESLTVKLERYK
ncbi:retrovirus-related pol polyprotein from transposon TNT 1-94 [Tanacetum coccineum]